IAVLTRSRRPLIRGPCALRSSALMPPSVFSNSLTLPFLPSAATRTVSSAASSEAVAIAPRISRSKVWISLIRIIPSQEQLESRPWHYAKGGCSDGRIRKDLRLGLIHQSLERGGLMDGKLREHLTVDLDPGLREPAHKSAIGEAVFAAAGVDALNPEGAEIPLLQLAADIVVLQRLIDGRVGGRDVALAAAIEAFGLLQNLVAAGAARYGAG